jgi:hypothetical protein
LACHSDEQSDEQSAFERNNIAAGEKADPSLTLRMTALVQHHRKKWF